MKVKRRRAAPHVIRTVRTEITVESAEFRILAPAGGHAEIWCSNCGENVQAWKPEMAASFIGVQTRLIYRCLESGTLHYTENPDGSVLICHNSLLKSELHNG